MTANELDTPSCQVCVLGLTQEVHRERWSEIV